MGKIEEINGKYKLNEYVNYRKNGICQIVDITTQNFGGQGKKEYYVLKSVYDLNMKVFVPLGSELEKEMQKVLSVDEVHAIIDSSKNVGDLWLDDCKARAALFDNIITEGDKAKMLWIIKAVSEYKLEVEAQKKKMKANDVKYLSLAENIITGEFAFSLNIPRNQVLDYIKEYLKK